MTRSRSKILAAVAAAGLAMAGVSEVAAQPAGNQAAAEKAFNEGDAKFNVGKYEEAAQKFIEAYEAWPVTEFLYNVAQSYRLGGKCKEALYFYQRFMKLKRRDDGKELSETDPKRAEKIDKFIVELEACAKQQQTAADQKPDDLSGPANGQNATGGTTGTDVATADDDDVDDDEDIDQEVAVGPSMVSARGSAGIAFITATNRAEKNTVNDPAVALTAGYPIALGPATVDVGAAFTFSPMPYQTMAGTSEQATLVGLVANAGVNYAVTPQIGARLDAGVGALWFGGLTAGNPFLEGGATTDGPLGLLHVRAAVAGDYAINQNLIVTLTPFALGFSPKKDGMTENVTSVSVMAGIGYRM